ncbi:hypothetical protein M900_2182 [Bacteriovorax sp. Seq25_V]|nr:hypothetical protein M900_2182 [Bacteriovorax sp. Seq25_V]
MVVKKNVRIQKVVRLEKNLEVNMFGMAADYHADFQLSKCLFNSVVKKVEVGIELDVKKLEIKKCHAPED